MDDKKFKYKTWVISTLRRASYRFPERSEALKRARTGRGLYKCEMCGVENLKKEEITLDHIQPVVPITGWDNWDGFIERLFCDTEGFQVICKMPCHETKTLMEDELRKQHRDKIKEELKLSEKEAKLEAKRLKKLSKIHGG